MIRDLKARMGRSAALAEKAKWARLSSGGMQAGGVGGESHSVGRYGISRRTRKATEKAAPGVRAAKSSESRKEE